MNSIGKISLKGINHIEDASIRKSLESVYFRSDVDDTGYLAEGVFNKLTSSKWKHSILCNFLSGWRATHGTALFVSGLVVRLHREAAKTDGFASLLLYKAAAEMSEIISEDTGVDDVPHNELFTVFADTIVGDDQWKLDKYLMPACEEFRKFIKDERLGGSIEEAILLTAASENWNTGEYSYFAFFVRDWITKILGTPTLRAEKASSYVEHHAGETELGHFVHAIKAWQLYCEAIGKLPDPAFANKIFNKYITAIRPSYLELNGLLLDSAIERHPDIKDMIVDKSRTIMKA